MEKQYIKKENEDGTQEIVCRFVLDGSEQEIPLTQAMINNVTDEIKSTFSRALEYQAHLDNYNSKIEEYKNKIQEITELISNLRESIEEKEIDYQEERDTIDNIVKNGAFINELPDEIINFIVNEED